jgi:hypothetical protein
MIMELKINQTKKEKNWDDSALNIITRTSKESVAIQTIYRYAPETNKTMTYTAFKEWRNSIEAEGGK